MFQYHRYRYPHLTKIITVVSEDAMDDVVSQDTAAPTSKVKRKSATPDIKRRESFGRSTRSTLRDVINATEVSEQKSASVTTRGSKVARFQVPEPPSQRNALKKKRYIFLLLTVFALMTNKVLEGVLFALSG